MENNKWGEAEQGWRKGPWTPEEDKVLVEYVSRYGEGRWSSVSKCAGLNRSGKSCRLRWVNYLRPGLKKGHITPQEEGIIIELHALWGNKWSTIARYLPGRTDNKIKNYWRTHFKKRKYSSCDQSKMQCHKQQQVGKDNKITISNVEASGDQGAGPTTRHEDEQSVSEGGKSNNNELIMQEYSTCYWPAVDNEYCLNNINGGLWEMDDQNGCSKMAIQNQPNIINANYLRGGGGGGGGRGGGGDAMNYLCSSTGGYIF